MGEEMRGSLPMGSHGAETRLARFLHNLNWLSVIRGETDSAS